jgi:hypothetical protein
MLALARGSRAVSWAPRRPTLAMTGRGSSWQELFADCDVVRFSAGGGWEKYAAAADTNNARGDVFKTALGEDGAGDVFILAPRTFNAHTTAGSFPYQIGNFACSVYGCGWALTKLTNTQISRAIMSFQGQGVIANLSMNQDGVTYEQLHCSGATVVALYNVHLSGASPTSWSVNSESTADVTCFGCVFDNTALSGAGTHRFYGCESTSAGDGPNIFILSNDATVVSAYSRWTNNGASNSDVIKQIAAIFTGVSLSFTNDTITLSAGTGTGLNLASGDGCETTLTNCTVVAPSGGKGVLLNNANSSVLIDGGSVTGGAADSNLVNTAGTFEIVNGVEYEESSTGTITDLDA